MRAEERQIITGDLRHALDRGEFFLVYQPKINLISGTISGFEALVRWRHPTNGVLYPATFIPIAEEFGLIMPIGEWVLREACTRANGWRRSLSLARWRSIFPLWNFAAIASWVACAIFYA